MADAAPRLGSEVVPFEYRLDIRPDLVRGTFAVDELIRVRVSEPVSRITLHAVQLEIEKAAVRGGGGKRGVEVVIDDERQTLTLELDRPLPAGDAEIRLSVRGRMDRKLRGLYLSDSGSGRYAVTQLQPADARRFFACFDEPALKAQFDLNVTIDARLSVISNMRAVSTLPGAVPGTKRIRFEKTPPFSTYMVALAIGDFDCLSDRVGRVPIRLCAQPGKLALGRYSLAAAKDAFEFYENWFGVDYPLEKLDLVAIPDFAAGGMENPGAVFFREASVLFDPDKAPPETRRWVTGLVAHELSHLWVGDLVTMQWWDDIWLNEGLATWMAQKAVAAIRPELEPGVGRAFAMIKALEADALEGSRATRTAVDDPAGVVELFDAMTNEKPAAVMSMVESVAGESAVRSALRRYLVTWSWGSATTDDFLATIDSEAGSAGAAVLRDFISRPGHPRIEVTSRCDGGTLRVRFTQRPVRKSLRGGGPWTVPVCFRPLGGGPVGCVTLTGETVEVDAGACGREILVNPGLTGFYRAVYARGEVGRLLEQHGHELAPEERIMLLDAEWSAFRAGEREVGEILSMVESAVAREESGAVVAQAAMQLAAIGETIADDDEVDLYRRWVARVPAPALARLETVEAAERRRALESELLWIAGVVGNDAEVRTRAAAFARDYLRDPWKQRKSNVDVMFAIAGLGGDEALYDALLGRFRKTRGAQERYRIVAALASFSEPELVDRTLRMTLDGTVRSQDAAALISRLLMRRDTRTLAWNFVRSEWPRVRGSLPPGFTSDRIVRAAGSFCDAERRAEVERFFSSPDAPAAPRALAASLASIDRCIAARQLHQDELARWLVDAERGSH
ncbi:MAG: M1 family metallopeptidase [Thermoanaerobaculia bacterium]